MTDAERSALYKEAFSLLDYVNKLLLTLRLKHEREMRNRQINLDK